MEKPIVLVSSLDTEVVVRYNAATREYSLSGCDENPIVAWGMLEYAVARVRRSMMQGDIAREIQNAPRISVPGGPLS